MFIGVMSGTSLDGVDIAVTEFPLNIIKESFFPYPQHIYQELKDLDLSLHSIATLDSKLAKFYAQCILSVLQEHNIKSQDVKAIGLHGQTIAHHPFGDNPYTVQIGNPSIVAYLTNICTIADFRAKDIAANGQGAPLTPGFHKEIFGTNNKAVVNIGGIANISFLSENQNIIGFDIGPGNCLLDDWCYHQTGVKYDKNGKWANTGKVIETLLHDMLADCYFLKKPPKSTGREYFNLNWIKQLIKDNYRPQDVQATLSQLTALTISKTCLELNAKTIVLCGGGVHNTHLFNLLTEACNPVEVESTASYAGINPDMVEALAFAWLAWRTFNKLPGNVKSVTGAKKDLILGGIYYP